MQFQNKVAVVTGAGSGFGEAIAKRFAAEGASVVIADLNVEGANRVAKEIGHKTVAVRADVTNDADLKSIVSTAVDKFGGLDIFVNNAGYTHRLKPLETITREEFDRVFAVNVWALMRSATYAVPAFEKRSGGVIINICSVGGVRPRPGMCAYNTSKGAAITLTKAMAWELAPKRVRVCGVNPTLAHTGMTADFMGRDEVTEEAKRVFEAGVPLGRMATPKDVAAAVIFLASEDASLSTGAFIDVDGGRGLN